MKIQNLKKYASVAIACMVTLLCLGGVVQLSKGKCKHDNKKLIAEIEATCTTDGKGAYVICADCNKRLYDCDDVIPATGHTEKIVYEIEPTCTEWGRSKYKMCADCGLVLEELYEDVPPLGHEWEREAQKFETEWGTFYGWSGDDICDYCGYDDSVNWVGPY